MNRLAEYSQKLGTTKETEVIKTMTRKEMRTSNYSKNGSTTPTSLRPSKREDTGTRAVPQEVSTRARLTSKTKTTVQHTKHRWHLARPIGSNVTYPLYHITTYPELYTSNVVSTNTFEYPQKQYRNISLSYHTHPNFYTESQNKRNKARQPCRTRSADQILRTGYHSLIYSTRYKGSPHKLYTSNPLNTNSFEYFLKIIRKLLTSHEQMKQVYNPEKQRKLKVQISCTRRMPKTTPWILSEPGMDKQDPTKYTPNNAQTRLNRIYVYQEMLKFIYNSRAHYSTHTPYGPHNLPHMVLRTKKGSDNA